jgi:hypothetical protein
MGQGTGAAPAMRSGTRASDEVTGPMGDPRLRIAPPFPAQILYLKGANPSIARPEPSGSG